MHVYLLVLMLAVTAKCENNQEYGGFMGSLVSSLQNIPVVGNFLRASHIPPEFFHPLHRPINLPPYSREEINVTYKIYTRQATYGTIVRGLELQQQDFEKSTFNPNKDIKIIIHGFLGSFQDTWVLEMMRAFLQFADLNVITVDWSGGSRALYSQATANTRVVGSEVAYLVKWLNWAYNVDPANVHIIGHSLGAHTSGYAGEEILGLGRITGLDPAEPYFQYMDPIVRLDPTDANFVDVIHSDVDSILTSVLSLNENGFGLKQPVGHIDFYPNKGRSQPGCGSLARVPQSLFEGNGLIEGIDSAQKEFIACSHFRAPKLFTDSILSECPYTAFQCDSFENYIEGLCMDCGVDGTNCAPMGLHADKWQERRYLSDPRGEAAREKVTMYLSTNDGPAFCTYHYRLDIAFGGPKNRGDSLRGRLKISFITEEGTLTDFDLTPSSPTTFKKGGSISYYLTHPLDLSGSRQALISWTYEPDLFDSLRLCPLFCSSDLQIKAFSLTNLDSKAERYWNPVSRIGKVEEVVMCHPRGDRVINIPSREKKTVVASTACPNILTRS